MLKVEVVAKLVAQGTQECAERGDLLPHRRPHPHADHHGLGIVVAEQLCRPAFTHSQRSRCKHSDITVRCSIEL